MTRPYPSKERLKALIELARSYRRWSDKDLAAAFDRSVHNLIPGSGVPKLDLVMRLSEALDWPIDMVVEDLCDVPSRSGAHTGTSQGKSAAQLNRDAWEAIRRDDYRLGVEIARQVAAGMGTAQEQAYALVLEASACESLGWYTAAERALGEAMRRGGYGGPHSAWTRVALANIEYVLGKLTEAIGVATAVLADWPDLDRSSPLRQPIGYASYVRGNCYRVLAGNDEVGRERHAALAIDDLTRAAQTLDDWMAWNGVERDAATAHTARAGVLEMQALLGTKPAHEALAEFLALVDRLNQGPSGSQWQESLGWTCVFAANVAVRHVTDDAALDRYMAIFTNKADEVAESLGNWTLRERVWILEHMRRTRASVQPDIQNRDWNRDRDRDWNLDEDDIRNLAGTMGRFPEFRSTGWQVLRAVRTQQERTP
ncbi:MAG: hypothetical protein U0575_15330 [Phycisphaerales bacterium]